MELKDLFITPIYVALLSFVAYQMRPYFTNKDTQRYFMPALIIKFFGAIALGLIYQFYYGDGDTFTYFHRGSRWIWEAFLNDPTVAFSLIFGEMELSGANFQYASRIYTYGDSASYAVVRLAGFFDIFTFHTYSATAIMFAALSFSGIWMIFQVFYDHYPRHHSRLALLILFMPSLFFWGSGLMKDTISLAALGWLLFGVVRLARWDKGKQWSVMLILAGAYTLYVIKIYILLCFLPAITFWVFVYFQSRFSNVIIKVLSAPVLITIGVMSAYFATIYLGEDHYRYSLDEVLYTAEQTAKWNYHVSERDGGSGYSLGDYDFSPAGLARKFLPAVVTSFFRPFLFEARNPVMLLAALENSLFLLMFIWSLFYLANWKHILTKPLLMLSIIFAVLFGFAVGVTTYNFGSLVRYKIPMMPFLAAGLYLMTRKKLD